MLKNSVSLCTISDLSLSVLSKTWFVLLVFSISFFMFAFEEKLFFQGIFFKLISSNVHLSSGNFELQYFVNFL